MGIQSVGDLLGRDFYEIASWSHEGQTVEWRASPERVTLDGIEVPVWVEERRHGGGGPDLIIKAAVRDGTAEVVDLRFAVGAGQGEIQQKHLRALAVDRVAVDLYSGILAMTKLEADASLDEAAQTMRMAEKFIEHRRLPREYRVITDDFLKDVADIYRQHISRAPTKAVARKLRVSDRMASTYVDRARKAGHLPPTKQGKKKA